MNGSHALAHRAMLNFAQPGWRVLDVGAGEATLAAEMQAKGCDVLAIDRDFEKLQRGQHGSTHQIRKVDLTVDLLWGIESGFDLIVAKYCLQHLLDDEAEAWVRLRLEIKPQGWLMVSGRHKPNGSDREYDRGDPLNGYDESGLRALAMATGWRLIQYDTYWYEGEAWRLAGPAEANAYVATCKPWI